MATMRHPVLPALLLAALAAAPVPAAARVSAGEVPEVGVREKLGTVMPMDTLLRDERGQAVRLRDVVDKPTLLLFVYYRCPAICGPLMREVARNLDLVDRQLGKDYRVVTVSFDPAEGAELATTTKGEILGTMTRRPPDDGWRFLTGDEVSIRVLTEAAGFGFKWDDDSDSYVHASSLIFS
ncbi:MAG: SCO family protein, partial [Deltaproteobacteria bacterium]|nr:SCO family protein [Deltaproteobacteria bacterium]